MFFHKKFALELALTIIIVAGVTIIGYFILRTSYERSVEAAVYIKGAHDLLDFMAKEAELAREANAYNVSFVPIEIGPSQYGYVFTFSSGGQGTIKHQYRLYKINSSMPQEILNLWADGNDGSNDFSGCITIDGNPNWQNEDSRYAWREEYEIVSAPGSNPFYDIIATPAGSTLDVSPAGDCKVTDFHGPQERYRWDGSKYELVSRG